jgi:hypothetical protein
MQEWVSIHKSNVNIIQFINRIEDRKQALILINSETIFDGVQHSVKIKVLSKLGAEVTFLNIGEAIYDKPLANNVLNAENQRTFP